jgi:hypothetical protein
MSASAWVRAHRDRPISNRERRTAFTTIASLSIAVTVLLALIPPGEPSRSRSSHRIASTRHGQQAGSTRRLAEESERAAEVFLASYLPYLYGRSTATEVRGATPEFARSLTPRAPRVPPAMRDRHPRVLSLRAASAPAGLIGVTALINDGGLIDYPVALLLARHGHRLLVSGLAGA